MNTKRIIAISIGIIISFGAWTICISAQTQAGQSLGGTMIKGKVPVKKGSLNVKLPRPKTTRLSNGLEVLVLENTRVPTFTMSMIVNSGGISDPRGLPGVAKATAESLKFGTKTMPGAEITEKVAYLGSTLTGRSGSANYRSQISSSGLSKNFAKSLDIFADVIMNPTFESNEFEKYKARSVQQVASLESRSNIMALILAYRYLYAGHPASEPLGNKNTISKIQQKDLVEFHRKNYRPNNSVLMIAGDISLEKAKPLIEKAFGNWEPAKITKTNQTKVDFPERRKIYALDRKGAVQTSLTLSLGMFERKNPDYFATLVMNKIFGGGPQGRLFRNLREDKGYTYGASSRFSARKHTGELIATADVRTEVTGEALKEFIKEMNRMRDEPVSDFELNGVKKSLIGGFAISLDKPQNLLVNIGEQKFFGFSDDYWDSYSAKVSAITAADVQRVAKKYLAPDRLQIVAVGDLERALPMLEKFGSVEMISGNGNR